jgi:NAD(P)-dependent dehydrogenase (short-subunit alcohol dehydrogenase family)
MFRTGLVFALTLRSTTAFVSRAPTTFARPVTSTSKTLTTSLYSTMAKQRQYTIADEKERLETYKKENNERYLNIDKFYDPSYYKGKRVAVAGCNRGVGLELAKELTKAGAELIAITRNTSKELDELKPAIYLKGIDVQDDAKCESLKDQITGGPIDLLICVAGYSSGQRETIDEMKMSELLKTLNTNTLGHLRVISSLYNGGLLKEGSKVVVLTSQDGSFTFRPVQNPEGKDIGYQISKCALAMVGQLLSFELKDKKIAIGVFHPGFNKTQMTEVLKEVWDESGAVDPNVGAKRVLYEASQLTMEKSGTFRNTEDGLEIPW